MLIGEAVARRLAAILAADVAGRSRVMKAEEIGTLAPLKSLRRDLIDPKIGLAKGRTVETTGDEMPVEFASAVEPAPIAAG
jgi:adenylate cyclase